MISYKLAKQLKEAGFPIKRVSNSDFAYVPTLSELIEACGDRFGELTKWRGDKCWSAGGGKMDGVDEIAWEFESIGNTPEEAVAKLWFKLNKRKV